MSRRNKNFLLRELEFLYADLLLWWQKHKDRRAAKKAAKKFTALAKAADAEAARTGEKEGGSRRRRNPLLRELEFVFADLLLWWQKRKDRKNVQRAARQLLERPEGADAVVEIEDEEGNIIIRTLAEPARAVSKWKSRRARVARIAIWRKIRPLLRWRTRHPFLAVLVVWGPVLAASGLITCSFIQQSTENSASKGSVSKLAEEPDPELGQVRMTFSGPPSSPLSIVGDLPEGMTPGELMRKADLAFLKKNYAEAEEFYRLALPYQRRKPLVLFKIFLSVVLQDRTQDAESILPLIPAPPLGASPANFYARAVLAIRAGNPTEAISLIAEGRALYPIVAGDYETAIRDAGIQFPH